MIAPPERLPERDTAILAMLPNVGFDGWTKRALKGGAVEAGLSPDDVDLLFPLGTVDMIETFCDLADRRMEEAAADFPEMRPSSRVRAIIALGWSKTGRTRRQFAGRWLCWRCRRMPGCRQLHRTYDRRDLARG